MNFPDNLPTCEMSPPRFATTDAIDVRRQFPMNHEQFDSHSHSHLDQSHLAKRARISENNNNSPSMMMANPSNPAMGKGTGHIFFKTRMCVKFKQGACRNGENCNFAHGVEDMRHPPPNWEELVGRHSNDERSSGNWDEDHRIMPKMKICKKFYNGEECPYGDKCSFLHEHPGKFRDDSSVGRFRESSAISIGTNGSPPITHGDGSKLNGSEGGNRGLNNNGLNGNSRGTVKSTYWKTRLCIKWETTGHCPFGVDCHFAHGQAELQVPFGRIEAEAAEAISTSTKSTIPTLPNVASSVYLNDAHSNNNIASAPQANEVGQDKRSLLKWKGLKKINRIYGDWLDDDFPLVQNLPS